MLPGSDHEAVYFSLNTKPKISKKVLRAVYLFSKADMCALKAELMDFQSEFLENHSASQSVEDSWNMFKNKTNEHGFRPGRSRETQLLITSNDLAKSLDKGEQVDAIVLDFSKAFDRAPYQRLLSKLHHYGIRDSLLLWIDNFLTKRSQRVVVDGEA